MISYFRQTSKDKISAALRTVWERRIVSVRSRQKVLQIWSNSIAEAAKNGGHGQDMLGWDSYERMKSEMVSTFLWIKERGRMVKKLERAVAKIAAKRLQVVRRREEQATRMKKLKPDKTLLQNADRQPARVVVSARPKLKERLAKVMPTAPDYYDSSFTDLPNRVVCVQITCYTI